MATGSDTPRLAPLPEQEWSEEMREIFAPISDAMDGRVFNVFTTLARHPKLLKRWLVFANHCLVKSSLSARDRELVILRAGWLSGSAYEWAQHQRIAREAGLDDEEIGRVRDGAGAGGWSASESALLASVDELIETKTLSDKAWTALSAHYDEQNILDLIFTAGNYATLAMALNALGVEIDEGI